MMPDRQTAWYFYADPKIDYFCQLCPDMKIPDKFRGPYDTKDEARRAWLEWAVDLMDNDDETDVE